jgi:hypothetical protein
LRKCLFSFSKPGFKDIKPTYLIQSFGYRIKLQRSAFTDYLFLLTGNEVYILLIQASFSNNRLGKDPLCLIGSKPQGTADDPVFTQLSEIDLDVGNTGKTLQYLLYPMIIRGANSIT